MSERPFVLHVDDEPDSLRGWSKLVKEHGQIELDVMHPSMVTLDQLARASVVLVDFQLTDWQARNEAHDWALRTPNGIALLTALQQLVIASTDRKPRAFSLYTSHKANVAGELLDRAHLIARAHNIEWVFDKSHRDVLAQSRTAARIAELALAVMSLPDPWPASSSNEAALALKRWLCLADEKWSDAAWRSVLRCRPPLHGFAAYTHSVGVLRWLLHKILPYPCFLLDELQLAARLHVTRDSLRQILASESELKRQLDGARYRGALATFDEQRWWRSAVDSMMFGLARSSRDGNASSALKVLHPEIQMLGWQSAFVVLGGDQLKQEDLAASTDVVELYPDDWPPYADQAWATRSAVEKSDHLRALVLVDEED